MNVEVERLVWLESWRRCGDSLRVILSEALSRYNRTPGYDERTRLHASIVGTEALDALREALLLRWPKGSVEQSELYIEMRARLRSYLTEYLLRRMVPDHPDSPFLRDALFAIDLGI